jgi:imidazolonepropionase-like amidohydrolase
MNDPARNRRAALLIGALLLPMACTRPAPQIVRLPYVPDTGTLAVRCGTLIDGESSGTVRDAVVLIENGRISAVGTDLTPPGGMPVLDLSGYTVLPGLIDMHAHVPEPVQVADLSEYFRMSLEEQLVEGRKHAEATVRAGFTTVRNVGAYMAGLSRTLKEVIDAGDVAGPRMQIAGIYLTIPGGGGDLLVPDIPEEEIPGVVRTGVARGADEFRRKARIALEEGADFLKVIASGAVLAHGGKPGEPEMTLEEIAAVVEVAHAAGKRVAAHAHGARSVKEAILAGADTIEHASLIDDEGIRLAKERGVALAMDVYNGDYINTEGVKQGWPQEFIDKSLATTEAQRVRFAKAYAMGVPLVFGTDSGVYPHGDNARQFRIMVERGMKPIDAIRSATSVAAHYMDWSDDVGTIAPGRFGDLIAVRGDPLIDIALLEDVRVVIKGGLIFKRPEDPS